MNLYRRHEKFFLTIFTVLLWCVCYFGINIISRHRKTHILALPFEQNIPFVPFFVIFYMLTYVIIFMVIVVVKDIKDFRRTALAFILVIVVSSIFYLAYPVEAVRPNITNPDTIILKLLAFVYIIAEPYNLFPSLHIALTTLALLICFHFKRFVGYLLIPFVTLITASTLFLKQHYIVDILLSIFFVSIVYYFVFMKGLFDRLVGL